jgi:hypothetical protein
MRKCPLSNLIECVGKECPLYNLKLDTCILPRLVAAIIKLGNRTELTEVNYDGKSYSRST